MHISNKVFEIKKILLNKKLNKNPDWQEWQDKIIMDSYKTKKAKIWIFCSKLLKDKSPKECKTRYNKINYLNKKGRWTKEEDKKLIYLVNKFGKNWILFSKIFSNRNAKQIRIRHNEYIDDKLNLKPFTEKEDRLLLSLHNNKNLLFANEETQIKTQKQNIDWKEIRLNFPNRPFTKLKRRLKVILKNQRSILRNNFADENNICNNDLFVSNTSAGEADFNFICNSNCKSESLSFPLSDNDCNNIYDFNNFNNFKNKQISFENKEKKDNDDGCINNSKNIY